MSSEILEPVNVNKKFSQTAEAVFDAWLKPEIVCQWMFVGPNNKILHVHIDERIGGKFSILELSDTGEKIDHYGEYFIIDKPHELSFTLQVPRHFPGVTHVSIKLAPLASGCLLQFTQTGIDRKVIEQNWKDMFDKLAEVLDK